MKLSDLESLLPYTLAAGQSLFRVQRIRGSAVRRGPLALAPAGLLASRFDLALHPCAYFAESPDTCLYEAVFRREAPMVSLDELRKRELVTTQVKNNLVLGDLRPHASNWPVLQSLRFLETQELAQEAYAAEYAGLIYRSAQQFGQDCVVLFDPPSNAVVHSVRMPLVDTSGAVNQWVMHTALRSRVPVVP